MTATMSAVVSSLEGESTPPPPQPTMLDSSSAEPPPRAELREQLDEDGNAVKVGNLVFVEGILGQGAYGTVRLAKRTTSPSLTPPPSRSATPDSSNGGTRMPTSSDHRKQQQQRMRQRGQRKSYMRSASAPTGNSFFQQQSQEVSEPHVMQKSSSSIVEILASPFKGNNIKEENDSASNNEDLVAVKIFNKSILKRIRTMERDKRTNRMHVKTAYENVEREIALMKKLSHPNLVALYDVIDSPEADNLYMVLEYMPLGEILTYQGDGTFARRPPKPPQREIDGVVDGHFDEKHAALFFVDILHALGYLHQHHICHRDLKPENILLDACGVVKISDFGVSHFFEDEQNIGAMRRLSDAPQHHPTFLTRMDTDSTLQMTGLANVGLLTKTEGTWCFWSPEMCSSSSFFSGYASDMWAAGVCLYAMVTGKLPFFSEVPTELFDMIAEANVPYKGLGLSNSLVDLLEICLEKDPAKRAGVGDCLRHPFLQVARNTRIRQLSDEFAQSRRLSTKVEEDDIRKAFRIVTTLVNPAMLLKNAQKHIQEGFQSARDRLSMGGSTFSSSSSLVGSDEEKPAAIRGCIGSMRNTWTPQAKKASFQQVGASLESFESTASESSGNHPSSSGKLFPIPQGRVMTESTRILDLKGELEDAAELNICHTERTSNASSGSVEHAAVEHAPEESSPTQTIEQSRKSTVTVVEKRASAEMVEEETALQTVGSPKRLRKKESKEQCTIQ